MPRTWLPTCAVDLAAVPQGKFGSGVTPERVGSGFVKTRTRPRPYRAFETGGRFRPPRGLPSGLQRSRQEARNRRDHGRWMETALRFRAGPCCESSPSSFCSRSGMSLLLVAGGGPQTNPAARMALWSAPAEAEGDPAVAHRSEAAGTQVPAGSIDGLPRRVERRLAECLAPHTSPSVAVMSGSRRIASS